MFVFLYPSRLKMIHPSSTFREQHRKDHASLLLRIFLSSACLSCTLWNTFNFCVPWFAPTWPCKIPKPYNLTRIELVRTPVATFCISGAIVHLVTLVWLGQPWGNWCPTHVKTKFYGTATNYCKDMITLGAQIGSTGWHLIFLVVWRRPKSIPYIQVIYNSTSALVV